MQSSGKLTALACVVAAAALAAGCVPAINYGSVPPDPELTTRITTTTLGTTARKPFTTRKHSAHTISWAEYSGEKRKSTTTGKYGTTVGSGTYTVTYTGTTTGISGTLGSGGQSLAPNETDMPQTVTQTVKPEEPVDPPQTAAPVADPPHEEPPQTAAPKPEVPEE